MKERVVELIKPYRSPEAIWEVRIEATRALLDVEFQCSGIDVALMQFIAYLNEESSLKGFLSLSLFFLIHSLYRNLLLPFWLSMPQKESFLSFDTFIVSKSFGTLFVELYVIRNF